jgi:Putative neutral zinc metallopeptidase
VRWTGVVLGAALALAGCGSSPDQDNASPTPPAASATAVADDAVLDRMPEVPEATASTRPPESAQAGENAFLKEVFDDAQAVWRREFEAAGIRYAPATITIFRDEIDTACGTQSASIGPFYCPADSGVYLDRRFFDALSRRAGVRLGDFAQAYVVAHEVAHHVQKLLGILQRTAAEDEQDPEGANARSVRVELQADCFAHLEALALPPRTAQAGGLRGCAAGRRRRGQRLPAAPRHGHDQARGVDARFIQPAPALADDRVRAGHAVCVRHPRTLIAILPW